jgi:hypothetical protein
MSDVTTKKELYSVDTNTMPWKEFYVEQLKAGFLCDITRTPASTCYA